MQDNLLDGETSPRQNEKARNTTLLTATSCQCADRQDTAQTN
jgi:hypothetical protein